jgi:hypothetical protein
MRRALIDDLEGVRSADELLRGFARSRENVMPARERPNSGVLWRVGRQRLLRTNRTQSRPISVAPVRRLQMARGGARLRAACWYSQVWFFRDALAAKEER